MTSVLGSAPACLPCTALLSVALLQPSAAETQKSCFRIAPRRTLTIRYRSGTLVTAGHPQPLMADK